MGLLSMGAAMMGAPTQNFGKALGAGLQGGVSSYSNAYEMAQKTGLQQAQMKLLQNQDVLAQRRFTMGETIARGQDPMGGTMPQSALGGIPQDGGGSIPQGGVPSAGVSAQPQGNPLVQGSPMAGWQPQSTQQGAPQNAPQGIPQGMPQGSAPQNAQGRFLLNLTPEKAVGYQMMGLPDMMPAMKLAHEGYRQDQGGRYISPYDGSITTLVKLDSGQAQNADNSISNAKGYTEAAAANAYAIAAAQERAKSPYSFQTINLPDGPQTMRTDQASAFLGGGAPTGGAASSSSAAPAFTQDGGFDIKRATPAQMAALKASPGFDPAALQRGIEQKTFGYQPAPTQAASSVPGVALERPADAARKMQAVTQEMAPNLDYSKAEAANLAQKGKALSGQLMESQELLKRITMSRDAQTKFKAGGGAEARSKMAQMAQAVPGMPSSVVDALAGGDLSALQVYDKFASQEAMATMRKSLESDDGKGSQGNRISMQEFFKKNPNITTDERASEKLFNFLTTDHANLLAQHDHFASFVKDPNNPKSLTAFDNSWAHKALDDGIVNPQIVTGQAKGLADAAANSAQAPAPGQAKGLPPSPQKPKGAPLQGQIVNGYKFKGGSPGDQSNWEKQ